MAKIVKIVLCGPPRSGKSCLREGLKQAIRAIPGAPYPFVITACPDGEGSWFQATVNQDPELAAKLKADYKASSGGFTPEFVDRVSRDVERCSLPLTLVDIGGIPSPENHVICRSATHAVLLAGTCPKTGAIWSDRLVPWWEFCRQVGLTVVAEVKSDYRGAQDTVQGIGPDSVLRGSVHYLERGEPVQSRPMIRELAAHLVKLASGE